MRSRPRLDDRPQRDDPVRVGPVDAAPRKRPDRCRLRRRQVACAALLWTALLLGSGCQLNRSFFQMDSNSKVPFFGVDLTPRWPGRESSVEGVSRLQSERAARPQSDAAQAAAQPQTPAPARSLALPLSDSVVTSVVSEGAPVETFR